MTMFRERRTRATSSSPPEQMRATIARLIEREAISIVFQPILDLRCGDVIGYEALTRPADGSGFTGAADLFQAAESVGCLDELERLARRLTFAAASKWSEPALLFLNNSPPVFASDGFVERISGELGEVAGLDPRRIVLEITERTDHGLIDDLGARAWLLRELGFQVALDDVGAGTSGLNRVMSLRPNWLKLDLELIQGIDVDPFKQNLIRFFVRFAKLSNMGLIGEGIERREELVRLIELGVSHGQGFYLARPGAIEQGIDEQRRIEITHVSRDVEARRFHDITTVRVGTLVSPTETCDQVQTVGEAYARLMQTMQRTGMVVLDGRRYLGWISLDALQAICDHGRGHTLLSAAPLMGCLVVGADMTLAEALELVASRPQEHLTLPVVVQEAGRIAGVVMLRQLLLAAAEAHRYAPRHVAPLTGLPSRVQADRWLTQRIKGGDPCDIVFIDVRDFDAYNRAHGFEMGDTMLCRLVGIIRAQVTKVQGGAAFFAHLGEDRFMLSFPGDAGKHLSDLIGDFEAVHGEFFSPVDQAAEAFSYVDPAGQKRIVPLTALRVVHLPKVLQRVRDPRELYQLAERLRMQNAGDGARRNAIITDRRQSRIAQRASA